MIRLQSAVFDIPRMQSPQVMSSPQHKLKHMSSSVMGFPQYSFLNQRKTQKIAKKKLTIIKSPETPAILRMRPLTAKSQNYQSFQSILFKSQDSTTQSSILQKRIMDTNAFIEPERLELLFNIKVNQEQLLRFVTKIYQQSQQGQLNLAQLGLSDKCIEILGEIIQLSDIFSLILSGNPIGDTGIQQLSSLISKTSIISLTLSNCNIGHSGFSDLIAYISHNHNIVHLNVGNPYSSNRNRIGLQGAETLREFLKHNSVLQVLNISSCSINQQMASMLSEGFQCNKTLVHLDISENDLTDGNYLLQILIGFIVPRSLQWLEVQNNKIGNKGLNVIVKQLRDHWIEISRLNLANTKLTLVGLQTMLENWEKNQYLTTLTLDNNMICGEMRGFITLFLSANNVLQHLSLSNCSLLPPIISSIAMGLSRNTKLTYLDLSRNQFGDKGVLHLVDYFNVATSYLTCLKLKRCGITDESATPLFIAINKQLSLIQVDCSQNLISDISGLHAIKVAKYNKKMVKLKLTKNLVPYEILDTIEKILIENNEDSKKLLVPELIRQANKISDNEAQEKVVQQKKIVTENKKLIAEQEFQSTKLSVKSGMEGAVEKTRFVEDKLKKTKEELQQVNKKAEQTDKFTFFEIQKLDEKANEYKAKIRDEKTKSAHLTKSISDIHNEIHNFAEYSKQATQNLKFQNDVLIRKVKNAETEYLSFLKQVEQLKQKQK